MDLICEHLEVDRYYFYVELDGNINSEDGKDMLIQLRTVCDRLKLVGTYRSNML